ncbi:DUF6134 family protein [Peristeroidobacter agariperforans]|uniref:DUF6134 family protein n=1 Tax=Peristeroidobacter agariperforans TaxID=268404 RepID=UPI0018E564B4|nr:DUF6134 family protein [Peristeroidobacter agariperforans]
MANIQTGALVEHPFRLALTASDMHRMSKIFRRCLLAALLAAPWPALANHTWDFRVFLDEKEIGAHRFDLIDRDGQRELISEARMKVKLLFVTAYTYEHRDVEHWQGDCLSKLSSTTDDNGEKHRVDVQRREGATIVQTLEGTQRLGECVLTFAYWNPAMLQQTQLLNSQDGEHVKVKITDAGADSIVVRGVKTPARRYELRSEKLSIDLWYSEQQEWLALESKTERGQKLIYKLK